MTPEKTSSGAGRLAGLSDRHEPGGKSGSYGPFFPLAQWINFKSDGLPSIKEEMEAATRPVRVR